METTASFGYWIRRQRKALDLTQQALAERVGCSLAAIKKIESDERRPSRQIAERLADILGVPASQRETFLEVARGLRPVDQLLLAREPAVPTSTLPTGIVTFLFTDIEGSTLLSQKHPDAMKTALARHHAILRMAIELHNGHILQIVGDSFSAAFENVLDALNAALAGQHGLRDEPWGEIGPIHVRMGLHTGMAEMSEETTGMPYAGYSTIAITHRIMSAAHGGQILLSQVTRDLMGELLPSNVTLLDVGEHRLKDVLRPIHLYQVTVADLPSDFPPLKSLSALPNNLPTQLTSFIGREHELSEIKQLLTATHLLTLTGPGGTGKTRLALQLAAEVLETSPEGVWLVELAPLADPTLVAQTIAATLGVREQPGRTILDALMDYVRAKSILLILDNCEHLIEACAQLANTLLRAAPRLKILDTSREPLGIAGETSYRVPSLPLPDPRQLHDIEALAQNDCVHLFVDRAMAAYPSFRLKEKNSLAIADICRRLDGIPLAIELASARTTVFPPEEIAARLDDRFRLLTGGSRTALERHQTLFALIEWSHNLLSEAERVLLRRLSVFAGGWSFDAAQAMCGKEIDGEVLDLLTHLVDKSLVDVQEETEQGRYRLPETIRQFARDKLYESGEAERARDRHLDFFLRFAEEAEPKLRSGEQLVWLDRLETEHDNLRTALGWSLESGKGDLALRLAGALAYFWELRGSREGIKWLDEALTLSAREQKGTIEEKRQRAKALYGSGRIRAMTGLDMQTSRTVVEESLRLSRELGDKWWMAVALENLGFISNMVGDVPTARAQLEEGVSLAREVGDLWLLALCLERLAGVVERTDAVAGCQIREQGVALARTVGDRSVLSEGVGDLAPFYLLEGNFTKAAALAEEALTAARELRDFIHVMLSLILLTSVTCFQGDTEKAKGYCFQALDLARDSGFMEWLTLVVLGFGVVAIFSGQSGRGVRLFAVANVVIRQRGVNLLDLEGQGEGGRSPGLIMFKQVLEKAQAQLGAAAFQAAWAEGQQMTLEQAIKLATEDEAGDSAHPD